MRACFCSSRSYTKNWLVSSKLEYYNVHSDWRVNIVFKGSVLSADSICFLSFPGKSICCLAISIQRSAGITFPLKYTFLSQPLPINGRVFCHFWRHASIYKINRSPHSKALQAEGFEPESKIQNNPLDLSFFTNILKVLFCAWKYTYMLYTAESITRKRSPKLEMLSLKLCVVFITPSWNENTVMNGCILSHVTSVNQLLLFIVELYERMIAFCKLVRISDKFTAFIFAQNADSYPLNYTAPQKYSVLISIAIRI
jgi:hypothetical protein